VIIPAFVRVPFQITCLACARSVVNISIVIVLHFLVELGCKNHAGDCSLRSKLSAVSAETAVLSFRASNSSVTLQRDCTCFQIHWDSYTNSPTDFCKQIGVSEVNRLRFKISKQFHVVFSILPAAWSILLNVWLIVINYWLRKFVDEESYTSKYTEYQKDIEDSIPCTIFLKNL